MKNERISRIYIFYVNEFKLAQYARDTGKVSLFYNKRKTTKRVVGFMEVKKFLDILFMKRVGGPVANINQFHMIH